MSRKAIVFVLGVAIAFALLPALLAAFSFREARGADNGATVAPIAIIEKTEEPLAFGAKGPFDCPPFADTGSAGSRF